MGKRRFTNLHSKILFIYPYDRDLSFRVKLENNAVENQTVGQNSLLNCIFSSVKNTILKKIAISQVKSNLVNSKS